MHSGHVHLIEGLSATISSTKLGNISMEKRVRIRYPCYGFVTDLRMDWKPLDLGIRTSIGQHGVEGTVYGAGFLRL